MQLEHAYRITSLSDERLGRACLLVSYLGHLISRASNPTASVCGQHGGWRANPSLRAVIRTPTRSSVGKQKSPGLKSKVSPRV